MRKVVSTLLAMMLALPALLCGCSMSGSGVSGGAIHGIVSEGVYKECEYDATGSASAIGKTTVIDGTEIALPVDWNYAHTQNSSFNGIWDGDDAARGIGIFNCNEEGDGTENYANSYSVNCRWEYGSYGYVDGKYLTHASYSGTDSTGTYTVGGTSASCVSGESLIDWQSVENASAYCAALRKAKIVVYNPETNQACVCKVARNNSYDDESGLNWGGAPLALLGGITTAVSEAIGAQQNSSVLELYFTDENAELGPCEFNASSLSPSTPSSGTTSSRYIPDVEYTSGAITSLNYDNSVDMESLGLASKSAIVVRDDGAVVGEKSSHTKANIASTTKIMTAWLATKYLDGDSWIDPTSNWERNLGGYEPQWREIWDNKGGNTASNIISQTMYSSANIYATELGRYTAIAKYGDAGNDWANATNFINLMYETANAIGMTDSPHFCTASGWLGPKNGSYSEGYTEGSANDSNKVSASDMGLLTINAMKADIPTVYSTGAYTGNHNGATEIKGGSDATTHSLVSQVEYSGHTYYIIALESEGDGCNIDTDKMSGWLQGLDVSNLVGSTASSSSMKKKGCKEVDSSSSGGNSSIAEAATSLAYDPANMSTATSTSSGFPCTDTFKKVHDAIDGESYSSADCGVCASLAIRWAGADDEFPTIGTSIMDAYMASSDKWELVYTGTCPLDETKLQPGDVCVVAGGGHIKIYTGNEAMQSKYPGVTYSVASGSLGDWTTRCENNGSDGRTYHIYRNVKSEENSIYKDIAA